MAQQSPRQRDGYLDFTERAVTGHSVSGRSVWNNMRLCLVRRKNCE